MSYVARQSAFQAPTVAFACCRRRTGPPEPVALAATP